MDLPADVHALADAARCYDLTAIDQLADRLAEAGDAALLRATLRRILGIANTPLTPLLDTSVVDLWLSKKIGMRAAKGLLRLSQRLTPPPKDCQLKHVLAFSAKDLLALNNVGTATVTHIRSLLGSLGLKLRGD